MIVWTYNEEELPERINQGATTYQHRLIGEKIPWDMRKELEEYLVEHFGPKHDKWRLKFVRVTQMYTPGHRSFSGHNAVLRFTTKEDAMLFRLGWDK